MAKESEAKTNRKKYKKRNEFKINIIYNEQGENLDKIVERAFERYYLKYASQ